MSCITKYISGIYKIQNVRKKYKKFEKNYRRLVCFDHLRYTFARAKTEIVYVIINIQKYVSGFDKKKIVDAVFFLYHRILICLVQV